MMRIGRLVSTVLMAMFCLCTSVIYADDLENAVVIEVVTNQMSADDVEKSIATPIESLISQLQNVALISVKYQENEADITVEFEPEASKKMGLVDQVRQVLDNNANKFPENIVTLSVSLANTLPKNPQNKVREAPQRSYAGNYLGHIQSSNELLPIITTFFAENDAVATSSGHYSMNEGKQVVRGRISGCKRGLAHAVNCVWRDKYGAGSVEFVFTDDYKSFNAKWGINDQPEKFKWTGVEVSVD